MLERSFFEKLVFVPDLRNTDFHIEPILLHHFAQILMKLINAIVNFFWLENFVVLQNLWYFLSLIGSVTYIKHHFIEMNEIPCYSGIFQQLDGPIFFRLKHPNNFFHPVINKKLQPIFQLLIVSLKHFFLLYSQKLIFTWFQLKQIKINLFTDRLTKPFVWFGRFIQNRQKLFSMKMCLA